MTTYVYKYKLGPIKKKSLFLFSRLASRLDSNHQMDKPASIQGKGRAEPES